MTLRIPLYAAMILSLCCATVSWSASDDGVTIRSNSLKMEEKTGDIRFEGDVEVHMNDAILRCEILTVHADEGDPSRILSGEASGKVTLIRGNDRVDAREADFDLEAGTVKLKGLPRLTREKTTIEAEEIVYSMEEGTASFLGPVKALFDVTGDRP